jgi:hypothetical protein
MTSARRGDSLRCMSSTPNLTQTQMDARIAELETDIVGQEERLDRLQTELNWWRTGKSLFSDDGERPAKSQGPTPPKTTPNGKKPTLREAIFIVMGEKPGKTWQTSTILETLDERGWLPNGDYRLHHGRSMLSSMARKGQLKRTGRGRYRLKETT